MYFFLIALLVANWFHLLFISNGYEERRGNMKIFEWQPCCVVGTSSLDYNQRARGWICHRAA